MQKYIKYSILIIIVSIYNMTMYTEAQSYTLGMIEVNFAITNYKTKNWILLHKQANHKIYVYKYTTKAYSPSHSILNF